MNAFVTSLTAARHASNGRKSKDESISSIGFVNTLDARGVLSNCEHGSDFIISISRADFWSQGSLSVEQGSASHSHPIKRGS